MTWRNGQFCTRSTERGEKMGGTFERLRVLRSGRPKDGFDSRPAYSVNLTQLEFDVFFFSVWHFLTSVFWLKPARECFFYFSSIPRCAVELTKRKRRLRETTGHFESFTRKLQNPLYRRFFGVRVSFLGLLLESVHFFFKALRFPAPQGAQIDSSVYHFNK